MTAYHLPSPPTEGHVWDVNGLEWTRTEDGRWTRAGHVVTISWSRLLAIFGPLSDTRPVQVGDRITLAQLADLPAGSIAANGSTAYLVRYDGIWTTGSYEMVPIDPANDSEFTLLRIGDGS